MYAFVGGCDVAMGCVTHRCSASWATSPKDELEWVCDDDSAPSVLAPGVFAAAARVDDLGGGRHLQIRHERRAATCPHARSRRTHHAGRTPVGLQAPRALNASQPGHDFQDFTSE